MEHMVEIVAVAGGLLGWILTSLFKQWRIVRVAAIEADLKRQMLGMEMDPQQMERILRAGKGSEELSEEASSFTGDADSDKVALVNLLAENDYSGDDIARVLKVFEPPAWKGDQDRSAMIRARAAAVARMVDAGKEGEEIEQMLQAFHNAEVKLPETRIQAAIGKDQ